MALLAPEQKLLSAWEEDGIQAWEAEVDIPMVEADLHIVAWGAMARGTAACAQVSILDAPNRHT